MASVPSHDGVVHPARDPLTSFLSTLGHALRGRPALVAVAWRSLWLLAAVTRLALTGVAWRQGLVDAAALPRVIAGGMVMDAVTALYMVLPFALLVVLTPRRVWNARAGRALMWTLLALGIAAAAYLGAAEYFFFDEFNARFNYVAVEYLIYPTEVFGNIRDAYPVYPALAAAGALGIAATWWQRAAINAALRAPTSWRRRGAWLAGAAAVAAVSVATLDLQSLRGGGNRVADELQANGVYSFFSAMRNAHIDYDTYYATLTEREASARVARLVGQLNTSPTGGPNPFARHVDNHDRGAPRDWNVIVLLQESMGSEFVGSLGGRGLTPNIDRIAAKGLSFTQVYASGTRTVRGMEAVATALPPVPPESVVKRTGNEGLFNLATIARQAGYAPTFVYGGYGTFDNMNAFFGGNGWRVVDRTDMPTPRFANIWGIADEELMDNALSVFDRQIAAGERVFSVVMSTSNHKPFTFPEGIPGVAPQGGGRDAGVRYADHAIGHFYDALQQRDWGRNTLLVIVADHGARVYGRAEVPVPTYAIPFVVTAPGLAPARIGTLASQLDVGPTVLGLLGLSYDSRLPGRDILRMREQDGYAVFNHNRNVAMMRGDRVAVLGFGGTVQTQHYDAASGRLSAAPHDPELESDARALFQTGYRVFTQGLQAE